MILFAVETCHGFNYDMTAVNQCMVLYRDHAAMDFKTFRPPFIRETWWNDVPSDVAKKFFFGTVPRMRQPEADEVFLPVKDDYANLPYKTKAICQWALDHGYTELCKADDDSFIYVDRMLKSDFRDYAWLGRYNGGEFVAGGPAYWLNEAAMKVVAAAPVNIKNEWAEDKWASAALIRAGYKPHFDSRYVDLRRGKVDSETLAVCECDQHTMRQLYKGK